MLGGFIVWRTTLTLWRSRAPNEPFRASLWNFTPSRSFGGSGEDLKSRKPQLRFVARGRQSKRLTARPSPTRSPSGYKLRLPMAPAI
eukprot:971708-Amphidinium_carterae.1